MGLLGARMGDAVLIAVVQLTAGTAVYRQRSGISAYALIERAPVPPDALLATLRNAAQKPLHVLLTRQTGITAAKWPESRIHQQFCIDHANGCLPNCKTPRKQLICIRHPNSLTARVQPFTAARDS